MGGEILYANKKADAFLINWGIEIGEKLPSALGNAVNGTLQKGQKIELEVELGHKTYRLTFNPLAGEARVIISGTETTSFKQTEMELRKEIQRMEKLLREGTFELTDKNNELKQEILERKRIEKSLRDNLRFQEPLLDAIPIPIFFKDMNGVYLGCNELFASGIFLLPKENILGHSIFEFNNRLHREFVKISEISDRKLLRERKKQLYEVKLTCAKTGEIRNFLITKALYFDTSGKEAGIVGIMQDITECKKGEDTLQKREERYKIAAELTGQLIYDYDIKNDCNDWAGAIEKLTGYSIEEFQSFNMECWALHIHPEERKKAVKAHCDSVKAGIPYHEEYRFQRKDGSYFYAEDSGIVLKNKSKQIYRMLGVIKDITEKKIAEDALAKEEEIRKKEIHHRIKNNLQVISSLLELQADKFKDEKVVEAFRESQKRVLSMAIIHEELYKAKDTETIDFAAYLRKLTFGLLNSYAIRKEDIKLKLELEKVFLEMDTAIPLGIIINELVSNSLKHAFPVGKIGEIQIKLSRRLVSINKYIRNASNKDKGSSVNRACLYTLIVSDNGLGFPKNLNFRKTDSFGLQLVNTLVEQLDATIEMEINKGTEFRINFKEACL